MIWNTYYYNCNKRKIELFNIFNHCTFNQKIMSLLNNYKFNKINKEEFTKEVKNNLIYYFWSKCEWELIISKDSDNKIYLSPWIGSNNIKEETIDITEDTLINWQEFANTHINKQIYKNKAKIDIYDQVNFVLDTFIDYLLAEQE